MRVCDRCKQSKEGLHERTTKCDGAGCSSEDRVDELCPACCEILGAVQVSIMEGRNPQAVTVWKRLVILFRGDTNAWHSARELTLILGVSKPAITDNLYTRHKGALVKRLRAGYSKMYEWQLRRPEIEETSEVASDLPSP